MSASNIKIMNRNDSYGLNEACIKRIVLNILKLINKPQNTELEVIFLDDESIRALNKRYKKEDRPTDVLSFKIERKEFGLRSFLGEIFISSDTAFENSKIFGTGFERELTLYIIHGILHLFGYDDENAEDRARMSKRQTQILGRLCETENFSKVSMRR